jgi:hypothetical protein
VIKALLAKKWKDEQTNLTPGVHFIDEEFTVRLRGSVTKEGDQLATPTVAVPLISVLALFWEKAGLARDEAMGLLREALIEAMDEGRNQDAEIKSRIDDVSAAISAVRNDLLAQLPKMPRAGRTLTKNLRITVTPVAAAVEAA